MGETALFEEHCLKVVPFIAEAGQSRDTAFKQHIRAYWNNMCQTCNVPASVRYDRNMRPIFDLDLHHEERLSGARYLGSVRVTASNNADVQRQWVSHFAQSNSPPFTSLLCRKCHDRADTIRSVRVQVTSFVTGNVI
jgi:hypothetical protein